MPPANKMTAANRAYLTLKDNILKGAYKDGEQLRQDVLAGELGCSRIPVREALLQLSSEKLIRFIPYKGAVVAHLSAEELREIFEIRYLLESAALRYSMAAMTREDLDRMQGMIDRASESQEKEVWSTLNWEFHVELYRIGNRPRLLELISEQHANVDRYIQIYLQVLDYHQDSLQAHGALLRCCRMGDPVEACVLLHDHLRQAYCRLRSFLENGRLDSWEEMSLLQPFRSFPPGPGRGNPSAAEKN